MSHDRSFPARCTLQLFVARPSAEPGGPRGALPRSVGVFVGTPFIDAERCLPLAHLAAARLAATNLTTSKRLGGRDYASGARCFPLCLTFYLPIATPSVF